MIKKERFMTNMECHQMNRRVMKTWGSMETKVVSQISLDLEIFGEARIIPKEDLRVFLETSRIFSEVKNQRNPIDLKEEKISSYILS